MQPEKIALLIFFAASLFFYIKHGLFFLHMLQLSSYKNERYAAWSREEKNARKLNLAYNIIFLPIAATSLSLLLLSQKDTPAKAVIIGVLALVFAGMSLRKNPPSVKPLVFTTRIKRLLFTLLVLFAAAAAGSYFLPLWCAAALVGSLAALVYLAVPLSNILNRPVDNFIYNKYFNAAQKLLASSNAKTIAITGSFGKTSTKFILGALLSPFFDTLITPESYNTPMGVSKVINGQLRPTHEIFIAEMGAAQPGDIAELCRLCNPSMGVISSIGRQHEKTMGSLENIIKTKFELADHLKSVNGRLFANCDNEYIRTGIKSPEYAAADIISYGIAEESALLTASDIKAGAEGITFTITSKAGKKSVKAQTGLLGRHNVINILAAAAVCESLGIGLEKLPRHIARLEPVPHRLQLIPVSENLTIIDDAYNSNPDGAAAALEALSWFADTKKVLVTPGMVELGESQYEKNKNFGKAAAAVCDIIIVVGETNREALCQGAQEGGAAPDRLITADSFQAAKGIFMNMQEKRTVLLENDLTDNY